MIIRMEGMKLVSVANIREHWGTTRKRNNRQRSELSMMWNRREPVRLPVEVTMYRISPRALDCDNLQSAFKHLRDEVATMLLPETQANQHGRRGNDSDPRITWFYGQRKGKHAVEIIVKES